MLARRDPDCGDPLFGQLPAPASRAPGFHEHPSIPILASGCRGLGFRDLGVWGLGVWGLGGLGFRGFSISRDLFGPL